MSTADRTGVSTNYVDATTPAYEDTSGDGWVMFAGIMLSIVGTLNVVYGIAAIDNSSFYAANAEYVITDLQTFGWFLLGVGTLQFVAAFGIWARAGWARWVGIITAAVNSILQILFISGFPLLSVTLFAIDVLVIYGLLAYGKRSAA